MGKGMSAAITIDLAGVVFHTTGRKRCNDCEFDFDCEDSCDVPLLLWSDNGELMACLCWPCAEIRMGKAFAE
jgi:hypothetical protein